jgi:hypothetical protein
MTRQYIEYKKLNEVKVKKINSGYYLATIKNNGREKKVYISYWNGSKMDKWKWSNNDLFDTKKEAVLSLEEIDFDLIDNIKGEK